MTPEDPAIDQARMAILLATLGADRLEQLLLLFLARLTALSAALAAAAPVSISLRAAAHKHRGSASSLGLNGLAIMLTRLERVIDHALAPGANSAHGEIARVMAELADLQAATQAALAGQFPGLTDDHAAGAAGALKR